MGRRQIYTSVQNCMRGQNCTSAQITRRYFCTEPFLHEGIKLHEDTFAQVYILAREDNFARSHFCTSENFAHTVNFARVLFLTRDGSALHDGTKLHVGSRKNKIKKVRTKNQITK